MKTALALCSVIASPSLAAEITSDELTSLPAADVVFLGEVHDNPAHHANQLQAIDNIAPTALVFEMLTPDQAARIERPLPDQDELARLLDWESSGWPDFAMYYPLFEASPSAAIFGAAVPRDAAREAMGGDLTELFSGDARRFGLDTELDAELQEHREQLQARAHCDALPESMLPDMVAIQRWRDAELAASAHEAHEATGGPVVVITGTVHTRNDWGAPAKLRQAAPDLDVLSLGQYEVALDAAPPHDFWLITDPHPRPDPCDAFR